MRVIGIDVGYGATKHISGELGGKLSSGSFRSLVGNYVEGVALNGFREQQAAQVVEIGDEKYLVGDAAAKHSTRQYTSRDRDWISSVAYEALVRHALAQCQVVDGEELVITTGLPVSYYKADKEKLTAKVRSITGENAKVFVIPQPVGAFFSLLFDEAGYVFDERLSSQRIGVLDIGFYTTDLLTIDGLDVVDRQIGSFENGVSTALEAIKQDIMDIHGLKLDLRRAEDAVRRGTVTVFGEDKDISAIVSKRLKELEAEIEAGARTVWNNAADLDKVILSGGGAEMLRPYLHLYRHATVIGQAALANAAGYSRFSIRQARK